MGVKVTIPKARACYIVIAIYLVLSPKSSNTDRRSLLVAESFQITHTYSKMVIMVSVVVVGPCILRIFSFRSR